MVVPLAFGGNGQLTPCRAACDPAIFLLSTALGAVGLLIPRVAGSNPAGGDTRNLGSLEHSARRTDITARETGRRESSWRRGRKAPPHSLLVVSATTAGEVVDVDVLVYSGTRPQRLGATRAVVLSRMGVTATRSRPAR